MSRIVYNIFFDKSDNIYLVDSDGILYLYIHDEYFPFLHSMENIKNCFAMNDQFYVHTHDYILLFDSNLRLMSDKTDVTLKDIKQIVYCPNRDIMTILYSDNSIRMVFNICTSMKSLWFDPDIYLHMFTLWYCPIIDKIKIVDNYLLIFGENMMYVYLFVDNDIQSITCMNVSVEIFDSIYQINQTLNLIYLTNGKNIMFDDSVDLDLDFRPKSIPQYEIIFVHQSERISLVCDDWQHYTDMIKSVDSVFSPIAIDKINSSNISKTIINLKNSTRFRYITNGISRVILYNGSAYYIGRTLNEFNLCDESIHYDELLKLHSEKTNTKFIIDVNSSIPILDQVEYIIPQIYRLNNELLYHFEYLDDQGKVTSHGEGVTRSVFTSIRKEIDNVMAQNMKGYSKKEAHNLGKILYFCSHDGTELFSNIHPYFFYRLSKPSDYITLLKKFKNQDYELFRDQYLTYIKNPEKLKILDLDIATPDEYIKYLFTIGLSDESINLYDELINGFNFYQYRHKQYDLIKKFSIIYYIKQLIPTDYFEPTFSFYSKIQEMNHILMFKKLFGQLSMDEKLTVIHSLTGSKYYRDEIKIIFVYSDETGDLPTIQTDVTIVGDLEIDNVTISVDSNQMSSNLTYKISTCHRELIIFVEPTEKNITEIIKALSIEDNMLKN